MPTYYADLVLLHSKGGQRLDIATLRDNSPQKRSGMARVISGSHSFNCTPTRLPMNGINHTYLCLSRRSWCSFTDPGGMES